MRFAYHMLRFGVNWRLEDADSFFAPTVFLWLVVAAVCCLLALITAFPTAFVTFLKDNHYPPS